MILAAASLRKCRFDDRDERARFCQIIYFYFLFVLTCAVFCDKIWARKRTQPFRLFSRLDRPALARIVSYAPRFLPRLFFIKIHPQKSQNQESKLDFPRVLWYDKIKGVKLWHNGNIEIYGNCQ